MAKRPVLALGEPRLSIPDVTKQTASSSSSSSAISLSVLDAVEERTMMIPVARGLAADRNHRRSSDAVPEAIEKKLLSPHVGLGRIPRQSGPLAISTLLVALVVPLQAQQPAAWKDPASHVSRFISVGQDVRLEVLDWGGAGRPLVLLPGGGDTAHVFDDFAPKLISDFRVYGITRRGFGESGFAPLSSGSDTFGDDVLAVLDALKLESPVLVGHSIGGQELSSIGTRRPNRVAGLVYLDAAYPYAFDNGKVPTFGEISKIGFPQSPPPTDADLATFDGLRQYYTRVLGFTYPEAELRQKRSATPEGGVGPPRAFPGGRTLTAGMKQYAQLGTPALFLVSSQNPGRWAESSTDPKIREQIAGLSAFTERQAKAIEDGLPTARVVRLPGANHYVFLSNEDDVLREMRTFIRRLQ